MAERLVPALALLLALLCGGGANALESGQALPGVRVEELGELKLHDEQLSYAAWDSRALLGKLNVIQYLAARLSSKSLNKPFTDQLEAAGLPWSADLAAGARIQRHHHRGRGRAGGIFP